MKRLLTLLLVGALTAAAIAIASPVAASAGCTSVIRTETKNGVTRVYRTTVCSGSSSGGGSSPTEFDPQYATWSQQQFIDCRDQALSVGASVEEFCDLASEAPVVTPAVVQRAFASVPLPPSHLEVQPPNGRTLVNFDTNFFTDRPAFTRVVTLLGQRITLRIEPTAFTWHFGTGESRTTSTPGAPYPRLLVTHDYERKGRFSPRVDTTYGATFRVGNGPWRPVPGTVTITGPTVALQAVEARPVLTAP